MNIVHLAPISNRESYSESFQALDENGDAIDLSSATIVVEMREKGTSNNVSLDVDISTTTFTASLTVDQVRALNINEYDIGCTIELSGETTQFFIGVIDVLDGVVS